MEALKVNDHKNQQTTAKVRHQSAWPVVRELWTEQLWTLNPSLRIHNGLFSKIIIWSSRPNKGAPFVSSIWYGRKRVLGSR